MNKLRLILLCLISFNAYTTTTNQSPQTELEQKLSNNYFKQITSILVQVNGQLIYEHYGSQINANSLHDIRSASKTFTSLAVGLATDSGLLASEHTKIMPHLSPYQVQQHDFKGKREMTYANLLTMNPPMECNDWNSFSEGNEERMYLRADWTEFMLNLPERGIPPWEPKLAERFNQIAFSYCTGGVFLVGKALENVTGERTDIYLREHLFEKMKIDSLRWHYSPKGHAQTGGGVRITSRDLIKIGQLLLDRGIWKGEQLLSQQWIEKMMQPRADIDTERHVQYGYLLWIYQFNLESRTITAWAASGNGGNYLWIVPSIGLTAVITSTAFNQPYMHRQSQEIFSDYLLKLSPLVTDDSD
ncbi:serine hydrolase domain-containing protein [Planctobacterium marinum]|uniref:Beta-lactamase-related domain-containing protein n=1 Tax=Planctobacterium marinum TaxID=1631968 RepID=A0AA48HJA6_9ALTE|nr:hypothetical protein MACH26_18300 [Planctobacterium marinum]